MRRGKAAPHQKPEFLMGQWPKIPTKMIAGAAKLPRTLDGVEQ
jgi:hypothetical protein